MLIWLFFSAVHGFLTVPPHRQHVCAYSSPSDGVEELLARAAELRREAQAMEDSMPNTPAPAPPPSPNKVDPNALEFPLSLMDMQDAEFREIVRRQVVNAFDNYSPAESGQLFDDIWARGPSRTADELARLAVDADNLEKDFFARRLQSPEVAGDGIRVLRSRIRMWAKGGGEDREKKRFPWELF